MVQSGPGGDGFLLAGRGGRMSGSLVPVMVRIFRSGLPGRMYLRSWSEWKTCFLDLYIKYGAGNGFWVKRIRLVTMRLCWLGMPIER